MKRLCKSAHQHICAIIVRKDFLGVVYLSMANAVPTAFTERDERSSLCRPNVEFTGNMPADVDVVGFQVFVR